MAVIHLGTRGYVYKHWKGLLYPTGLPASRWLLRYAQVFTTVELNATFYCLPTAQAVDGWRDDLHGHALLDAFDLAELLQVPVHVPPEMDRPPAGVEPGTA